MEKEMNHMESSVKQKKEERYSKEIVATDYNFGRLDMICDMLPDTGKLLEIGAWDGTTIQHYRKKFKGTAYGIDISEKILQRAAQFFNEVKVCDLDEQPIPFTDGFFDVVVCGEVIEHIFDTDNLLIEIRRVLRKNGILVISTPNIASFFNRLFILFGFQPLYTEVSSRKNHYGNRFRQKGIVPAGHIRNFTYRAFHDIVTENGFKILEQKAATLSTNKYIRWVEKVTGQAFVGLGCDIILKCVRE
jgi:2-polyprenyl-3-methyl-5-hydroxy-6-metoxy-1,4-benzoquinol methylase